MEFNDEEQNTEQDIAVTEVDIGLRWDLNYEPPNDRLPEFIILHLPKRVL